MRSSKTLRNPALFEGPGAINRRLNGGTFADDSHQALHFNYHDGPLTLPFKVRGDADLIALILPLQNDLPRLFTHLRLTEASHHLSNRPSRYPADLKPLHHRTARRFGQSIERIEKALMRLIDGLPEGARTVDLYFQIFIRPIARTSTVDIGPGPNGAFSSRRRVIEKSDWGTDMDRWFVGVDEATWRLVFPRPSAHQQLQIKRWLDAGSVDQTLAAPPILERCLLTALGSQTRKIVP
jgi:hypothetical protein